MATTPYIVELDLEVFLTKKKLLALADDDQDGVVDAPVIASIILSASAEAESWIEPEYHGLFPFPGSVTIPDMLKRLTLFYAIASLFERHPEYVKKFGEDKRAAGMRDRAEKLGGQLQSHVRAFADLADPDGAANVGGITANNSPTLMLNSSDGSYVGGDF